MRDEILFTVNSPGEVSTWLAPTIAALRRLAGESVGVAVHILPCLYASGTEADVIRRMPGVDRVVPPRESLSFIMWGKIPRDWRPAGRGVVVFLGGEMLLAARLARRLRYPAIAYTHGHAGAPQVFHRFLVPREAARARAVAKGAPQERVQIVGDLMVDAAQAVHDERERAALAAPLGLDPGARTVILLPGSRPFELRLALPIMASAAARLGRQEPVQFVVVLSPYASREALARALEAVAEEADVAGHDGAAAECARALDAVFPPGGGELGARVALSTAEGPVTLMFWRGGSRAAMAAADLALTVPGSNTAELAAWGVPMVVCMPLHRPEEIPLDGVSGYLDRIPGIGRKLKVRAVLSALQRAKFVALPNQIAQEAIVPELISPRLSPHDVAREAGRLLLDGARLADIGSRLVRVMGPAGAAGRVAREALELLQR